MGRKHTCDGQCWAHMIRYGIRGGCDPFTARDAAENELAKEEGR